MRRRTKILATLGPASASEEGVRALVEAGADAFRLNFSHGAAKDHERVFEIVRREAERTSRAIPIVQDIQGPKIRTGDLPPEGVKLVEGETVTLRVGEAWKGGDVPVSYEYLAEDVKVGDPIFMDDGYIQTRVVEVVDRARVRVAVTAGGLLKRHKGVNFPGVRLSIKFPTEKDKHDLRFGQDLGVDYVAASFVRSAADLAKVRAELDDRLATKTIAKIELREGVDNLDEIVRSADGVMVARGDLGVELPPEDVPALQKDIITLCDRLGVPVITATQMLESMIHNPRPTRAEATDVFNAVLDGTSAVMLSGETATGAYPVEAVRFMARVAERAESKLLAPENVGVRRRAVVGGSVGDALADAAVRAAEDIGVAAIVTLTSSGRTARAVSKFKPRPPVIAATPNARTFAQLGLLWGVTPLLIPNAESETAMLREVDRALADGALVKRGDLVAVTSGRLGMSGTTNTLRVGKVGALDVTGERAS